MLPWTLRRHILLPHPSSRPACSTTPARELAELTSSSSSIRRPVARTPELEAVQELQHHGGRDAGAGVAGRQLGPGPERRARRLLEEGESRGDVVRLGRRDGAPRGRHLLAPAVAAVRCEPPHATPELRGLQRPPAGQDVGAPRAASASSACGRSRGAVAIHVPAHECSRAQFGIGAFEGSDADQEATAT